jgi:hypothetical protein
VGQISILRFGGSEIAEEASIDLDNKANKLKASYVLLGRKVKEGSRAPVNSAQLLLSVAENTPHCTVIGLRLGDSITKKLEGIFGSAAFRIYANIGEALHRIYRAILATAVSA